MNCISLKEASKAFGRILALDSMDMELGPGINVLLGQNGSGKSTLLRAIAGVLELDDGLSQVEVDEGPKSGMLFDHNAQWESLSGYDNAWFFIRSYGIDPKSSEDSLDSLFRRLGLWKRRNDPVSTYSFGMRRKLGIVQAMAHRPGILLMDEPSIGLDYGSRVELYSLLREAAGDGACIVLATNDVLEAEGLAENVVLLKQGKVVAMGEPAELVRSMESMTIMRLMLSGPLPLGRILEMDGVEGAEAAVEDGGIHLVVLAGGKVPYARILEGIMEIAREGKRRLLSFDVKEPDLGDFFVKAGGSR
jgi:ABC-2 type transport system ATP-binding protein